MAARLVECALLARAAPVAAGQPGRASALKRALIGPPRKTGELSETLLSKRLALPVFASDPLSSVAYASEAALVVLVGASAAAAGLVLPISIAIAAVMAIVVLSYVFPAWGELLHNQHALYIKRLLLLESRVFLSSVPYHLP